MLSDQKINKLLSIGLTTLAICKASALKDGSAIIFDEELFAQIALIFKNCEQIPNNPLLALIIGEGTIFLKAPAILKGPKKELEGLIREQEVTLDQLNQT